jgi:hypothetical protein
MHSQGHAHTQTDLEVALDLHNTTSTQSHMLCAKGVDCARCAGAAHRVEMPF